MKKKSLFASIMLLCVTTVFASNTKVDGIWYDFDYDTGEATVTYCGPKYDSYANEYSGDVVIPSSVTCDGETYSVTLIGRYAFSFCTGLTSVTIPNSVTSIGENAFSGCSSLLSAIIPNSVTTIGEYAFNRCSSMSIVTIGDSVTLIDRWAFSNCSGLTSVTIPNSVTSIGIGAFMKCTDLTVVTIGNSVTSIATDAFDKCSNLTAIIVDATNANYCDVEGVLFTKNKKTLVRYPESKQGEYTIPNSVISIGMSAFEDCIGLTSITIPNSVTSIGSRVFFGCTGLTSVTVPYAVKSIAEHTFYGCSSLAAVTIPNSVTSIGDYAFCNCTKLTSVIIPNSVTSIGTRAFGCCKSLISIIIPNSITSIGKDIFASCTSLTSVMIPNSIKKIGYGAFSDCTNLRSITIPNSVTSIGNWAFSSCTSMTSITCEAVRPPSLGQYVFDKVKNSIPIYVPAESLEAYKAAYGWKGFTNILPITAAEVEVAIITAKPTENSVVLEWPKVEEATVYTIDIKKNCELICTLSFNELGQLLNISFAAPSRNGEQRGEPKMATQTATGWQYTVSGLDANTTYTCTVTAKKSDDSVAYQNTITFTTKNTPTAIDAVANDKMSKCENKKIILGGHLYILRDGKMYTAIGAEVR